MLRNLPRPWKYSLIGSKGVDEPKFDNLTQLENGIPQKPRRSLCLIFTGIILSVFVLGFCGGVFVDENKPFRLTQPGGTALAGSTNFCTKPSIRREWRTLSKTEKIEYVEAVNCLRTKSSRLGLQQSLYDDFPWVHYHFGGYCELQTRFLEQYKH